MYYRYSIILVIWVCGVSNEETPKPTNQLLAGSSPRVTIPSEIVTSDFGSETFLACYINGYNISEIYWSKHGKKLSTEEYDIQTFPSGKDSATSKIRFENVQKYHAGNYNCHAESKNGSSKSTVRLNVVDAEMSPPAVVPDTLTPVTDQLQHSYETILWIAVVFLALIFLVGFYVLKKGCCFTRSCFSNRISLVRAIRLHKLLGTQGRPGKDERAGSDETHRKDGSINGRSDPEVELNGVEVQPSRVVNQNQKLQKF